MSPAKLYYNKPLVLQAFADIRIVWKQASTDPPMPTENRPLAISKQASG
jgi:hypothetical protein